MYAQQPQSPQQAPSATNPMVLAALQSLMQKSPLANPSPLAGVMPFGTNSHAAYSPTMPGAFSPQGQGGAGGGPSLSSLMALFGGNGSGASSLSGLGVGLNNMGKGLFGGGFGSPATSVGNASAMAGSAMSPDDLNLLSQFAG